MESYLWDWQLGGHQQPPGLTSYVKAGILYKGGTKCRGGNGREAEKLKRAIAL